MSFSITCDDIIQSNSSQMPAFRLMKELHISVDVTFLIMCVYHKTCISCVQVKLIAVKLMTVTFYMQTHVFITDVITFI